MFMIHIRMIENLLMMPSADIFAQGQDSALHGLWHLGRFHGLGDASGAQAAEEGPGKKIMGKYRNILENGGVLMGKSWKNIGTYRKIHYKWRFLAGQIIELMVELRKLFFSATVFFCVFWGGLGGISLSFCSFHYIYCFFWANTLSWVWDEMGNTIGGGSSKHRVLSSKPAANGSGSHFRHLTVKLRNFEILACGGFKASKDHGGMRVICWGLGLCALRFHKTCGGPAIPSLES